MKGNGQNIGTLFKKLYFYCLPTSGMRTNFINCHKYEFAEIGNNLSWQPRKYTADPELIKIGDNVIIGAGSVIVKDIPSNSVAVGVPCKKVGEFNDFVSRREKLKCSRDEKIIWKEFEKNHKANG